MADYWPQVISGAAGLLGSVIGTVGTLYAQGSKRADELKQQRQAIGFALAAEIEAYLDIVQKRGWVRQAEALARKSLAGEIIEVAGWLTEDEQQRDPFPIFSANMSNIGMVGPSCQGLGKFYTSVVGIRTTVSEMQKGKYSDLSPPQMSTLIEQEIDFWLETAILGRRLVEQLRAL